MKYILGALFLFAFGAKAQEISIIEMTGKATSADQCQNEKGSQEYQVKAWLFKVPTAGMTEDQKVKPIEYYQLKFALKREVEGVTSWKLAEYVSGGKLLEQKQMKPNDALQEDQLELIEFSPEKIKAKVHLKTSIYSACDYEIDLTK